MGMNLKVYINQNGIEFEDGALVVNDHKIFVKETDFNYQAMKIRGKLIPLIKYKDEFISEDDYNNKLLKIGVKELKKYDINPSFKQNKKIWNKILNMNDKTVLIFCWT